MHHLGVKEADITKEVILIPDPLLVPFLASFMDEAEPKGDYREYVTYTGKVAGRPLTVMSSGFGCMPMAIAVEELKHLGVEKIIALGLTAAIQPELKPGALFLAQGAVRSEGATLEYIDYPYPAVSDMELLAALAELTGAAVGIVRSHDATYRDSPFAPDGLERIARWQRLGVGVMDGETSALFVLGTILKVRCVSLCVVAENYLTGESLNEAARQDALKTAFLAAAKAIAL